MLKKFFPLDKNYLLERAQYSLRDQLMAHLVSTVITHYDSRINPLGLVDSFTLKIRNYKPENFDSLYDFYEKVCAIYRYKFGATQLEFLWDGSDHLEYYQKLWTGAFHDWVEKFCKEELFIQSILDLTVFLPKDENTQMIQNRMNHFVLKYFEVKIHKVKGLMVA